METTNRKKNAIQNAKQLEVEVIKNAVNNEVNLVWLPLEKLHEIRAYLDSVSYGAIKPFKF